MTVVDTIKGFIIAFGWLPFLIGMFLLFRYNKYCKKTEEEEKEEESGWERMDAEDKYWVKVLAWLFITLLSLVVVGAFYK